MNIGDKLIWDLPPAYEVYNVIDIAESSGGRELILLREGMEMDNYKCVLEKHIKDCVVRGKLEYIRKDNHYIKRHKFNTLPSV